MADRAAGLPVAWEGVPFILAGAVPTVLAGLGGWPWLAVACGGVTGFVAWFFRNPARSVPVGDRLVVSPADGRVVAIHEEFEPRYLKSQATRISIFLNVFNVHINRAPCAGMVENISYQPGQFLAADKPEATLHNEQNALMIASPLGHKVLCVQIAGLVARRIVCWAIPGERLQSGERFGLIRFGSRVDMFLPMGSHIAVHVGERVIGGETVIGELPSCVGHS